MLTIRETILRHLCASGPVEINYIVREVRTQATEPLPVLREGLRDRVRAELETLQAEGLAMGEWHDENEDDDGEPFYAWELTDEGYTLAGNFK